MFANKESGQCKLPLPAEKMPPCWNQEERMNALFSPFRSKSANPQDWASKYKFWQDLIYEWLGHTMKCSFSISELHEVFKRNGCRPLCLPTVVEELLRNNEIMPEVDFWQEPSDSWAAWSIDIFVKKPLVWSFSKLKNYVVTPDNNIDAKYIHLKIVNEVGEIILSILTEKKEKVLVPLSDLIGCCHEKTGTTIPENTVLLAVIWLKRLKKVVVKDGQSKQEFLIKLVTCSAASITEVETGLFELQKQEEKLKREIQLLEEEKLNVLNETKSYLAKGLRRVAKTHLRKKMEIENTIEKRSQALEKLQSLIFSIHESHSNTSVLSAYKIGTNVLKQLTQDGLSESNVRDVVDELSETLEEHKDVQTLLSDTLKSNESDVDLEQELEELLKADIEELPSVPDTTLNISIDELEQSLKNLSVEDTPAPTAPPSKVMTQPTQSKKILTNPQCT